MVKANYTGLNQFQHSLMNLGVETPVAPPGLKAKPTVSAFSDESWGGDPITVASEKV